MLFQISRFSFLKRKLWQLGLEFYSAATWSSRQIPAPWGGAQTHLVFLGHSQGSAGITEPLKSVIWTCKVKSERWKLLSRVHLFVTPWTIQAMEFSRPEYWSGEPFSSPGDLPNPGMEPRSPTLQADSSPAEPPGEPWLLKQHCIQRAGHVPCACFPTGHPEY